MSYLASDKYDMQCKTLSKVKTNAGLIVIIT